MYQFQSFILKKGDIAMSPYPLSSDDHPEIQDRLASNNHTHKSRLIDIILKMQVCSPFVTVFV